MILVNVVFEALKALLMCEVMLIILLFKCNTVLGCFVQVSVDVPDVKGRTDILKVHGSNKKFESDVSLEVVAMRTPGFSGADLADLLNEAAILTGRRGKTAISAKEIDDSIDRIVAGMLASIPNDQEFESYKSLFTEQYRIFCMLLSSTVNGKV